MGMLLTEERAVYRLQAHGYDGWLAYRGTCEMRMIAAVAPSRHFRGDPDGSPLVEDIKRPRGHPHGTVKRPGDVG